MSPVSFSARFCYLDFVRSRADFAPRLWRRIGTLGGALAASWPWGHPSRVDDRVLRMVRRLYDLRDRLPENVRGEVDGSLFLGYWDVAEALCPRLLDALDAQVDSAIVLHADPRAPFYREHVTHPLAVCYTGAELLDSQGLLPIVRDSVFHPANPYGPLARFHDRLSRDASAAGEGPFWLTRQEEEEVIWAAWYLASCAHDIAQCIDAVNAGMDIFRRGRWPVTAYSIPDSAVELFANSLAGYYVEWVAREATSPESVDVPAQDADATLPREVDMTAWALAGLTQDTPPLRQLMEEHCARNHSTLAAVWLLAACEEAKEFMVHASPRDRFLLQLVYELAAQAVLTHDWCEERNSHPFLPLADADENPLGWLLLYSDLLEYWSRPYRVPLSPVPPWNHLQCEFVYPFCGVSVDQGANAATASVVRYGRQSLRDRCRSLCQSLRRPGDSACTIGADPRCDGDDRWTLQGGNQPERRTRERCFLAHFNKPLRALYRDRPRTSPLAKLGGAPDHQRARDVIFNVQWQ